jgi:hypothetical protein
MKQIKFLSVLLAFVMLFTAQIPICAAGASATLSVEQSEISEQNNEVKILLESTDEILGGSFDLVYDSSVLEYIDVSSNTYGYQSNPTYAANRIRVSFAGTKGTKNGVILTFFFRPTVSDSCTTAFSFENVNLFDASGRIVASTAESTLCEVKILKQLSGIRLSSTNLTMGIGEKVQMAYQLTPEDASIRQITWHSYDTSIATIDQNGTITAHRAGTVSMACEVMDYSYCSYFETFTVTVYKKPNLTAMGGYVAPGESIKVAVRLDTVGETYTSGSLNLVYDPTALALESAVVGKLLGGCMTTINPSYRENAVRLNFLCQQGISGSGEICVLTFTALQEGEARIGAEQVLLYTDGNMEHNANIGEGILNVGSYELSVQPPENAEAWKEFTTPISFNVAPGIAGGSFIVSYDSEQLRFLGQRDVSSDFSVTVNENYAAGQIKISFAGTQGVSEGTLLSLCFVSKENATGGIVTEVGFVENSTILYTQSGVQVVSKAEKASFTVAQNQEPPSMGDIDYNETVDTRDATSLLRYLSGADDAILVDSFADLNGDGEANDDDMDYLMKLLAGWDLSTISEP